MKKTNHFLQRFAIAVTTEPKEHKFANIATTFTPYIVALYEEKFLVESPPHS